MLHRSISITDLQRQLKAVFSGVEPMRVVLSNNVVSGIVFSKEAADLMMQSGILDQLREELWELHDKETTELVARDRAGKTAPVSLDSYLKKHALRTTGRR
jgi:hypothetical protein